MGDDGSDLPPGATRIKEELELDSFKQEEDTSDDEENSIGSEKGGSTPSLPSNSQGSIIFIPESFNANIQLKFFIILFNKFKSYFVPKPRL